ncbi:unnamed protein product [Cyprideis torosa]|uniref:Uncharacterized protein n=1 Tax=Cyprideis torosa TaxID=163714 RepID=A0A7R8ZNS7_9CRUS|nr:unnamed protein product [Cyprideis torosa]CAG0892274.1 unnamed protein product [Cyprideis torosa]
MEAGALGHEAEAVHFSTSRDTPTEGHSVPTKHHEANFYAATKHAVRSITENLRRELQSAGSNIRATQLSPGIVETEFVAAMVKDEEVAKELYAKVSSLKDQDIVYVLSAPPHVAGYCNGQLDECGPHDNEFCLGQDCFSTAKDWEVCFCFKAGCNKQPAARDSISLGLCASNYWPPRSIIWRRTTGAKELGSERLDLALLGVTPVKFGTAEIGLNRFHGNIAYGNRRGAEVEGEEKEGAAVVVIDAEGIAIATVSEGGV